MNVAVLGMAGDRGGLLDLTLRSSADEDKDDEHGDEDNEDEDDGPKIQAKKRCYF